MGRECIFIHCSAGRSHIFENKPEEIITLPNPALRAWTSGTSEEAKKRNVVLYYDWADSIDGLPLQLEPWCSIFKNIFSDLKVNDFPQGCLKPAGRGVCRIGERYHDNHGRLFLLSRFKA